MHMSRQISCSLEAMVNKPCLCHTNTEYRRRACRERRVTNLTHERGPCRNTASSLTPGSTQQDFWTLSKKLGKLSYIIGFSKWRHSNRRRRAKILVAAILLLLLLCNRWNVIKVFLIFLYSTSQCKTSKSCAKHSVGFILKKPYPDTRPLFSIRILLCLLHQIIKPTAIRAPSITPPISPPIWAGVNLKEPLSEKEHCVSL